MNGIELRHERYLGESVYVGFDGDCVWLYIADPPGIFVRGKVGLSQAVMNEFAKWHKDFEMRQQRGQT